MYQRDYIHSKAIKTQGNNTWSKYKLQMYYEVVHSIVNQQKIYYQNEIECKANNRFWSGMWKNIRSVLNKNHKLKLPSQLSAELNNFFAYVGSKFPGKFKSEVYK